VNVWIILMLGRNHVLEGYLAFDHESPTSINVMTGTAMRN